MKNLVMKKMTTVTISYNNQAMTSIVDIPSKKQTYNVIRDNKNEVNNNSKEVGLLLPPTSIHQNFSFRKHLPQQPQ